MKAKINRILTLGIFTIAMTAFVSGFDQAFAQTAPGYAGAIPLSPNSKMSDALTVREKSGNMRNITNRMREAASAARAAAAPQAKSRPQLMAAPQELRRFGRLIQFRACLPSPVCVFFFRMWYRRLACSCFSFKAQAKRMCYIE